MLSLSSKRIDFALWINAKHGEPLPQQTAFEIYTALRVRRIDEDTETEGLFSHASV